MTETNTTTPTNTTAENRIQNQHPPNDTVTADHVAAEFGHLESGLRPVHESEYRVDYRYIADARNAIRTLAALYLPDADPARVRFIETEMGYSWPHRRNGEMRGDEWSVVHRSDATEVVVTPDGTVEGWPDGSPCRYAGQSWRDVAAEKFARTVRLRFPGDDLTHALTEMEADR